MSPPSDPRTVVRRKDERRALRARHALRAGTLRRVITPVADEGTLRGFPGGGLGRRGTLRGFHCIGSDRLEPSEGSQKGLGAFPTNPLTVPLDQHSRTWQPSEGYLNAFDACEGTLGGF